MKIIKSVTNHENLFIDDVLEFVDNVDYKINATICGYTWYGHRQHLDIKATYGTQQKAFVKEASDLDELFHSLHLSNGGDFQSFWFVDFQMTWELEGIEYSLSLCCYDDDTHMPASIKHYFIDENKHNVDSFFYGGDDDDE
jgi:hypothetical protein